MLQYGGGRPTQAGGKGTGAGANTAQVNKRNKARETIVPSSNGHNKDHHNNDNDNPAPTSNKHQPHIEKSETMSKATGAAANAQAASKYQPSTEPQSLV